MKSNRLNIIMIIILFISVLFNCEESIDDSGNDNSNNVDWITYTNPISDEFTAIYKHPQPGTPLPVIMYNHGINVELNGYSGAKSMGYDVADFVNAIADEGYAAIAPIRPNDADLVNKTISAAIYYITNQSDLDENNVYIIGFSKGGYISIKHAVSNTDYKAMAVLAPAITSAAKYADVSSDFVNISKPIYVGLGIDEPNNEIEYYTTDMVQILNDLSKDVTSKLDYDGDHVWFWQVRDEYWLDVINFIKSN